MMRAGSHARARARTLVRRTALAVAALCAIAVAPALAIGGVIRDPVQLRLEGYIDATEQQVNPGMMLDIWLERAPGRRFAMTNIIVLSAGNVSGPDIFASIQPLHPNKIHNVNPSLLE